MLSPLISGGPPLSVGRSDHFDSKQSRESVDLPLTYCCPYSSLIILVF